MFLSWVSACFTLLCYFFFFFLMIRPPPRSPLFPHTTLFRSWLGPPRRAHRAAATPRGDGCDTPRLPTSKRPRPRARATPRPPSRPSPPRRRGTPRDRKSTRLNSSHSQISYAVFCLKKNNKYTMRNFHSFAAKTNPAQRSF